jgi:hypothetical protein
MTLGLCTLQFDKNWIENFLSTRKLKIELHEFIESSLLPAIWCEDLLQVLHFYVEIPIADSNKANVLPNSKLQTVTMLVNVLPKSKLHTDSNNVGQRIAEIQVTDCNNVGQRIAEIKITYRF